MGAGIKRYPRMKAAVFADSRALADETERLNHRPRANLRAFLDDNVWADINIRGDFGCRSYNRGGVNASLWCGRLGQPSRRLCERKFRMGRFENCFARKSRAGRSDNASRSGGGGASGLAGGLYIDQVGSAGAFGTGDAGNPHPYSAFELCSEIFCKFTCRAIHFDLSNMH